MIVLGNVSGLLNLILFVFLLVFLAAIFASQLFRGEIPEQDNGNPIQISFFTIYNSFLGMYQILSSENWTAIMYNVTSSQTRFNTAWIGAAFCILWFVFANCKHVFFLVYKSSLTLVSHCLEHVHCCHSREF